MSEEKNDGIYLTPKQFGFVFLGIIGGLTGTGFGLTKDTSDRIYKSEAVAMHEDIKEIHRIDSKALWSEVASLRAWRHEHEPNSRKYIERIDRDHEEFERLEQAIRELQVHYATHLREDH